MTDLRLRDLTPDGAAFLGEMLYAAAFWRPDEERPPIDLVLAHPQAARYHVGWGRAGDVGVVAELDGAPVGCAWYRLFTEEDHGDGFIDPATPEVAIAVRDGHRGRGIGRELLTELHARARAEGLARVSLSANLDNPARRLYADLGYVEFTPDDPKERMVHELR